MKFDSVSKRAGTVGVADVTCVGNAFGRSALYSAEVEMSGISCSCRALKCRHKAQQADLNAREKRRERNDNYR